MYEPLKGIANFIFCQKVGKIEPFKTEPQTALFKDSLRTAL